MEADKRRNQMMDRRLWQHRMFEINSRTAHALLALTFAITLAGMLALPAQAQTYTVLYTFTGGTDGGWPYSGVVFDDSGNLYGTTETRGDINACGAFHGCGVVYKLDASGNQTVLHTFEGNADGRQPQWGNLLRDKAGNLLDTTVYGGMAGDIGLGVIYALTNTGKEIIVHRFVGGPDDGEEPQTGLIQGEDGTFYGTTAAGGSGPYGDCGTVFKLSKSGKVTISHSFVGADGCQPEGGLVMDAQGNMYGVTSTGGAGYGTVYKISQTGNLTTLHNFTGQPDGAMPLGILAIDKEGNLYGTTPGGGDPACTTAHQGCGIVFEIDTQGTEHILHSFLAPDGGDPYAGPTLDEATGTLYGSTSGRAAYNWGSIYKIDRQGVFTKLYDFTGAADGGSPFAVMTLDKSGTLYGTTYLGGLADGCDYGQGCGVVFKLTPQ
jgi:uncharacterized repeat protein (TIGR03803 family)